jgi:hypothetical protein
MTYIVARYLILMTTPVTINLGAINKKTDVYESPVVATKENEYYCPDCKKPVMLRKGAILKPHFSHYKSTDPCNHYNHPGESQIHRHAKEVFKHAYEAGLSILFNRLCPSCNKTVANPLPPQTAADVRLEHKFYYNGPKQADIAIIKEEGPLFIVEICHTHKTEEGNRPEPWIEVNAAECIRLLDTADVSGSVVLDCLRTKACTDCMDKQYSELDLQSLKWFAAHPTDFDWYVRYTLRQRDFTPGNIHRYAHDRFDYDAQVDTEENDRIIAKFAKFYKGAVVSVTSGKGSIHYIIDSFSDENQNRNVDVSGEGTVEIIKKILMNFI